MGAVTIAAGSYAGHYTGFGGSLPLYGLYFKRSDSSTSSRTVIVHEYAIKFKFPKGEVGKIIMNSVQLGIEASFAGVNKITQDSVVMLGDKGLSFTDIAGDVWKVLSDLWSLVQAGTNIGDNDKTMQIGALTLFDF